MDATTMPSIHSLLPKLNKDFPHITFASSTTFAWSPDENTVFYKEDEDTSVELLLHELSHGLLEHSQYQKDVELVSMESAAWDKAIELGATYGITIKRDTADDNLDTYRDWLHARSTCKHCEAIGYQSSKDTYQCVACSGSWRVNEARLCALRRYHVTT